MAAQLISLVAEAAEASDRWRSRGTERTSLAKILKKPVGVVLPGERRKSSSWSSGVGGGATATREGSDRTESYKVYSQETECPLMF